MIRCSLCLNSVLDLSDERESSQKQLFTNEQWKIIVGQCGRKFYFDHKKMEKKIKEVNQNLRQGNPTPTTSSSAQQSNESDARHMGCKKAKAKRRQNEMLSGEMEQVKDALKSLKEVVSTARSNAKESRVVQVRNDDEVMSRDITSITDPIELEYFRMRRREILLETRQRLQERERAIVEETNVEEEITQEDYISELFDEE